MKNALIAFGFACAWVALYFMSVELGFGQFKAIFAALVFMAFIGVMGFLSLITGAVFVSDHRPHWFRIMVGFAVIVVAGGLIGGASTSVDMLR